MGDHFNETNTNVVSIQMRNYSVGKEKEWKFKGTIFITFKNAESATAFVEDKDWKYNDREKNKGKGANKAAAAAKEEPIKEVDDFKMPKGAVLKLSGLGGDITRADIKEVLKDNYQVNIDKDKGDIASITYEKGEA